ncbi:MAG: fused MFS/spermidine synthase, partial [Candidatus Methylomirabilia bacterium]
MTDELRGHREVRRVLFCILACFFLSGATGLIYEVLWIRALGLVFGHTVFAITTVLTAFMAGLGLGSFLFGRLADRRRDLLRLYGILEGGIGLYCLGIPLLLSTVEAIHLVLYRSLHLSFYAFSLAQFGLTFLILVVPTTLMGATLPILSRFFVREEATLGRRVGLLYALNTLGAVLGAALAGYFLLPSFGMRGTLYLAATLNIGLAALVIVYDRHLRRLREQGFWNEEAIPPQSMPERAGSRRALGGVIGLTVIGLGLSGAASMVYEVAWSRALSLIIGSSTYAFTAMLVVFLVGIALGSYLFSQLWGERPVAPFTFGVIELGIGLTALLILPAFGKMPELFLGAMAISDSPGFVLIVQLLLSFVAMIVPTLLIGATLPCAVRIAARGVSQVGSDVGSIYAVNTLGAIVGTLLAGFVLIPAVGVQVTVKLAVLLNILVGAAILLVSFHAVASWR